MASAAHASFQQNRQDVDRLIAIHTSIGGPRPGRRAGVQCLNKAAIVLTSAIWEAYVEDVCGNAIDHMADHLADSTRLPEALKLEIAADIHRRWDDNVKKVKDRNAAWELADNGWKIVLRNNLSRIKRKMLMGNSFNTCKSDNVKDLFSRTTGLQDVSLAWRWQHTTAQHNCERLDRYITLRGDIAHRGASANSVMLTQCTAFLDLVDRLVNATDASVDQHLYVMTGMRF